VFEESHSLTFLFKISQLIAFLSHIIIIYIISSIVKSIDVFEIGMEYLINRYIDI